MAHTFFGDQLPRHRNLCSMIGEFAKSLPPPRVEPPRSRAPLLRDWIIQIPIELYQQSNGGSVPLSLPSLSRRKTIINRASLATKETLAREGGKPRTVDKDFFCLFVLSILASLHYLSSKKRKHLAHVHWSFHLLFVILTLKKTFSTWAFTLTGSGSSLIVLTWAEGDLLRPSSR